MEEIIKEIVINNLIIKECKSRKEILIKYDIEILKVWCDNQEKYIPKIVKRKWYQRLFYKIRSV
jgi:hypothetical protein